MDFFFFLRKITRGLNEKLLDHSEAAALCSCSDSAESPQQGTMRYLEEAQHRELIQEPRALGALPGSSGSWGASPPSNPDKHMAVCSCVLLFSCQRLFHSFIAAASSQHAGTEGLFLFLFGSHLRDVDRETVIGHRVSKAS